MTKFNNIDDFYKDQFGSYSPPPSDSLWSGIQSKLIGPRIEFLYKSAFKNFTSTPSEMVWRKIAAGLWFKNFIHFSPFTFNAYYMAGLTIVGTTAFVGYNNFLTHSSIPTIERHNENAFILFENRNDNIKENYQPEKNYEITPIDNKDIDTYIGKRSQTQAVATDKKDITTEQNKKESLSKQVPKDKKESLIMKTLSKLSIGNLTYSPSVIDISNNIFKNFKLKDIAIYDTIGTDYKGDDIVIKRNYFEASLYAGLYNTHQYNILATNEELEQNIKKYNDVQIISSFSLGLNLAYNHKNIHIESGVYYNSLTELAPYNKIISEIINTDYFEYFEEEKWRHDTVAWILDLDSYLEGETSYIPYIDSVQITVQDSSLVSITDTIKSEKELDVNNTYHIIGVPLMLGYEFKLNNFSITPKAGIYAGLLMERRGDYINIHTNKPAKARNAANVSLYLDYYCGVNLKYLIPKTNVGLFIEPNIRGSLNNMYQESYGINQKYLRFGINSGVSIRF